MVESNATTSRQAKKRSGFTQAADPGSPGRAILFAWQPLISRPRSPFLPQQIAERVAEMALRLRTILKAKAVMIGVLKGAAPFLADLSRAIQVDAPSTLSLLPVTVKGSAPPELSSSSRTWTTPSREECPRGRRHSRYRPHALLLAQTFLQQHPKSLRIATLLDKPSRRIEKIDADYVGFSIPNLFVIGYGMDYAERYRNLPDICVMPPGSPE